MSGTFEAARFPAFPLRKNVGQGRRSSQNAVERQGDLSCESLL